MKRRLAAQGDLRASHYRGHGTNLAYTLPAELLMVTLYLALPALALVECMRLIGTLTGEHASKSSHSRARTRQGLTSKKIQYWSGNQASCTTAGKRCVLLPISLPRPLFFPAGLAGPFPNGGLVDQPTIGSWPPATA